MELNYTYFILIGFVLLVPAIMLVANMRNLLGARVRVPRIEERNCSELPEHIKQLYAPYGQQLRELGFHPFFCRYSNGYLAHERSDQWEVIYANLEHKTYAQVTSTSLPAEMPGCEVEFSTVFADGMLLLTLNGRAHAIIGELPRTELIDVYGDTLLEQWTAHRERLDELSRQRVATPVSRTIFNSRHTLTYKVYLKDLSERGWVKAAEDDTYAFRARHLPGFTWKLIRGNSRWEKTLSKRQAKQEPPSPGYPPQVEVDDYHRIAAISKRKPLDWLFKIGVLAVSMVLFAIVFGIAFDIRYMLILLGVIAFHELGHLAAMRLFGYRDLQILFIPFFGAAAIGSEQQARSWHRVVVAFMGPLPGIIVGWTLLGLQMFDENKLLLDIANVMLIINYLNLLPMMPLDGGHIFKHVLFEKHPRAQVAFSLLSALLFALGYMFLEEPIFLAIAIFMFLGLPTLWLEASLLVKLKAALGETKKGISHSLHAMFEIMREAPFKTHAFPLKTKLAKQVHEAEQHVPITWVGGLITFVTYAAVMFLPLVFVFGFLIAGMLGLNEAAIEFAEEAYKAEIKRETASWSEKLARAKTEAERWRIHLNAAQWFLENEDSENTEKHILAASAISESFEPNDIRRAETALQAADASEDPEQALALLRHALRVQEANYGVNDPRLAETLVRLATHLPLDDSAQREGEQLLNRVVELPGGGAEQRRMAMGLLARGYETRNRFAEAEAMFTQAAELERRHATAESDGYDAYAQRELAAFYAAHKRYAEAEPVLSRILARETELPEDERGLVLPDIQSELGWVMLKQHKVDNARDLFEQALALQSENLPDIPFLGKFERALIPNLVNLLSAQLDDQDLPQATLTYKRIVEVLNADQENGIDAYLKYKPTIPQLGEVGSSAYWNSVQRYSSHEALRRMHGAFQRIKQSAAPVPPPTRRKTA